jgi:hypothetical protein
MAMGGGNHRCYLVAWHASLGVCRGEELGEARLEFPILGGWPDWA